MLISLVLYQNSFPRSTILFHINVGAVVIWSLKKRWVCWYFSKAAQFQGTHKHMLQHYTESDYWPTRVSTGYSECKGFPRGRILPYHYTTLLAADAQDLTWDILKARLILYHWASATFFMFTKWCPNPFYCGDTWKESAGSFCPNFLEKMGKEAR